jgi:transcriptional regulator with XRE-family HTH domain
MMDVMRSGRRSSAWIWVASGTGLAALVAGAWWLLEERTRGAEIATVLGLPVAVVALVVAALPKDQAGRRTEDLEPAFRELVEFLNRQFDALGTSPRDFARRHGFHPRAVNEILSGERMPPRAFLNALSDDWADIPEASRKRSVASVKALRQRVFDLRNDALQELRKREEEVERLQQEFTDTERDKERATRRTTELSAALIEKEGEREEVMRRVREFERILHDPRSDRLMIEAAENKRKAEYRRDSVDKELTALRAELGKEKKARMEAEKLSARLRKALGQANSKLMRAGGSPVELDLIGPDVILFGLLRTGDIRWGGKISAVGVVSVIYFGPFYFGAIYGSPGAPIVLKLSTLYGLAIAVWFAYAARETARAGGFRRVRFLRVVAAMAALFFLGVLV